MCLGIPGQIVSITDEALQTGVVQVSGVKREANLSCVVPANGNLQSLVGSWALVHVGFAMSIIDEEEAQRTLQNSCRNWRVARRVGRHAARRLSSES